jgi:exonuclease III
MGNRNAKTYLKVEGITGKGTDVILISDVRASNKGNDIIRLMGLTRNGSYKLYLNSNRESRGVGIAIKRKISHEIKNRYEGRGDNNLLMLDIVIKGKRITLGVVYGPNSNDVPFFRDIEQKTAQWGNDCIIGGDFNTIICRDAGIDNLDREGGGRLPNRQNSVVINEWIANGTLLDPFRVLYPEKKEVSYIPFRVQPNGNRPVLGNGKSRLDFFLISPTLLDSVRDVTYEDRLSSDFDHKEVVLKMGNREKGKRVSIYDSTINDVMADVKVRFSVYESLVGNFTVSDTASYIRG